jgi:hypothetical protein
LHPTDPRLLPRNDFREEQTVRADPVRDAEQGIEEHERGPTLVAALVTVERAEIVAEQTVEQLELALRDAAVTPRNERGPPAVKPSWSGRSTVGAGCRS